MSKQYSHLNQPLSVDISTPNSSTFDDGRTTMASNSFDSTSLPHSTTPHFVQSAVGLGQRTASKRGTFKRTNRVDASSEDLVHDSQQHEYNPSSSNPHASQHTRHPSGHRSNTPSTISRTNSNNPNVQHHPIHGAQNSRTSSGHDSPNYSTIPMTTITSHTVDPYDVPQPIPIPRRKSLPSIVKIKPGDYKIDETTRSSDNLQENETFIIENGICKRVTEQAPTYTESGTLIPQATVMTSSSGSPTLARRIILENVTRVDAPTSTTSSTGGTKRGSMPSLVNVARQRQAAPSKFDLFAKFLFF